MARLAKDYAALVFKGAAMGAADVVPGVSGGTIAFISGIYEELLDSIKSVNLENIKLLLTGNIKGFWEAINGWFLVAIFGGIGISVVSLAKVITKLLDTYPHLVWGFFFGLIIASIYFVGKTIKNINFQNTLSLIIGAGIAYWITILEPSELETPIWFVFISGAIAICAMILPGISGSFILLLMGMYSYVLTSIKELNILVLAVFGAGCATGLLGFSRVLSWLLHKYHDLALALLTGFMIGSLNKVWPWKNKIGNGPLYIHSDGREEWLKENVLPANFESEPQIMFIAILAIVGFATILILERFAPAKSEE